MRPAYVVARTRLPNRRRTLTPALEAAILLMVIGTTFLAPILLRLVIPREPGEATTVVADQPA